MYPTTSTLLVVDEDNGSVIDAKSLGEMGAVSHHGQLLLASKRNLVQIQKSQFYPQ